MVNVKIKYGVLRTATNWMGIKYVHTLQAFSDVPRQDQPSGALKNTSKHFHHHHPIVASMGDISVREYIRWLPEEPSEPTSTIVLTTPNRLFVDLRVLKPTTDDRDQCGEPTL